MAEGGFHPRKEDFEEVYKRNADMRDNDDKQELNVTQPFVSSRPFTPFHRGEEIEMKMINHEKTGLFSYAETSSGGERIPLLQDDELQDLYRRFINLKTKSATGLLDITDISEIPEIPVEDILSPEDKVESARRFIKSRYQNPDFKKLVISFSKQKPFLAGCC